MALLARILASFQANIPNPTLNDLDSEFNQLVGATGVLNGNSTGKRILTKYNHATEPVYEMDQLGAGPTFIVKQNGVTKVTGNNDGTMTFANTAVNPGLNADRVDSIEGANIAKLDTNVTAWGTPWFFPNVVAVETIGTEPRPVWICPPGTAITVSQMKVVWRTGSHTIGRSTTFQLYKENTDGGSPTTIGEITVTDGSTVGQEIGNDFGDVVLTTGQRLMARISAASGTLDTIQNITVEAMGTQRLT